MTPKRKAYMDGISQRERDVRMAIRNAKLMVAMHKQMLRDGEWSDDEDGFGSVELGLCRVRESKVELMAAKHELERITRAKEEANNPLPRIAYLHAEIKYRNQRIKELEQELAAKDAIIRKQVIMLAEKEQKDD